MQKFNCSYTTYFLFQQNILVEVCKSETPQTFFLTVWFSIERKRSLFWIVWQSVEMQTDIQRIRSSMWAEETQTHCKHRTGRLRREGDEIQVNTGEHRWTRVNTGEHRWTQVNTGKKGGKTDKGRKCKVKPYKLKNPNHDLILLMEKWKLSVYLNILFIFLLVFSFWFWFCLQVHIRTSANFR